MTKKQDTWSLSFAKQKEVIVRSIDTMYLGRHRGNGEYWYSHGTVTMVSYRYGYLVVSYRGMRGDEQQTGLFTLEGKSISAYHQDFRHRRKIDILATSEDVILLPLTNDSTNIILKQDLIDQIQETSYTDWERLSDNQLWNIVHLVANARKEHDEV